MTATPAGGAGSSSFSTCRRWFLYLIGFFESFLFGGAIFGWAQLVFVLKTEGIFLDKCDDFEVDLEGRPRGGSNSTGNLTVPLGDLREAPNDQFLRGCEAQDETFALIYTVACTVYSTPGFLFGYMLHHLGLAATRISGGTMLILGFISLGVASRDSPNWIYGAMVLLALGGNQLRMAGFQLANLFPKYKATALTIMSGIFAASAGLFLFIQLMVEAGFSRQLACWLLAGLSSLSVFLTAAMPCHHVPYEEDVKVKMVDDEDDEDDDDGDNDDPVKPSLFSLSSTLHLYWFFINLYCIVLFATFFNSWVSDIADSVEEAGFFSSLFSLAAFLTPLISPFPGLLMDFMAKRVPKDCSEVERRVAELRSPMIPLLTVSLLVTVLHSCLFFKHPAALYVAITCLTLTRPSVVAVGNAFVRIRFPASHFNRLIGIYGTIISLLTMIQYPHFIWAQHSYITAQSTMMILLLLGWLQPLHLLYSPFLRKIARSQTPKSAAEEPLTKSC
ncbi:equilibrative nucleobase transporter 1-like [Oratosquilla oratoria]|uniref:equilibrative nucleobase transporter 1-like n=1 Tax=Oratosquilla oratoria TaxID=337810 RepID=UPI003F75F12D